MMVAWRRWLRHASRRAGSRWRPLSERWLSSALAIVFPPTCLLCGEAQLGAGLPAAICGICRGDLLRASAASCPRCARPLPEGLRPIAGGCGACTGRRLRFERAIALGVYQARLREAVLQLKQARGEALALAVGGLLADACRSAGLDRELDYLVPVPVHWRRRLWRGTHAPELLVEAMAARLGVPAPRRMLVCRRKTNKQGTLLPTERRRNVRGAYRVSRGYDISAAHVLVVDDVMTTGATLNEVARTLRRAGAGRVSVAVVARGVGWG